MQDFWIEESIKDKSFEDFYERGRELGKGATSVVYRCLQRDTKQEWAVKIITKRVEKKVVRTEIGVLLRLQHPHIIRLKEIFETRTQILLVLELVTGGELFDRIVTCGYYSEKDAARCVSEMLEAVKYLHENEVIHRDLKPENLLYEDNKDDARLKLGPEVLKGKKYGTAVDMWSIGVITYILLCGYEPFYSDNEAEMFKKIMKCDYVFDPPWWDDVTDNAKDLISKLLVLDAAKRLTAGEALDHPWVKGNAAHSRHMEDAQSKLKQFNARRKLKAATDVLMAFSFKSFGSLHNRTDSSGASSVVGKQTQPSEEPRDSSTTEASGSKTVAALPAVTD